MKTKFILLDWLHIARWKNTFVEDESRNSKYIFLLTRTSTTYVCWSERFDCARQIWAQKTFFRLYCYSFYCDKHWCQIKKQITETNFALAIKIKFFRPGSNPNEALNTQLVFNSWTVCKFYLDQTRKSSKSFFLNPSLFTSMESRHPGLFFLVRVRFYHHDCHLTFFETVCQK